MMKRFALSLAVISGISLLSACASDKKSLGEALNTNDLVFEDTIPFLQKLKENGHKLFILTYCKF